VGDVREEVSGEVQYNVGEEFVAFLVFNQRGEPVTIGLAQASSMSGVTGKPVRNSPTILFTARRSRQATAARTNYA